MKITTRTDGSERNRGRHRIENWHLNDENNAVLKIRGKMMYVEDIERTEHLKWKLSSLLHLTLCIEIGLNKWHRIGFIPRQYWV